jgi:hypothetical protein
MAKKKSQFYHAVTMADQLAVSARKQGNDGALRGAITISEVAMSLAKTERAFAAQANDLISALSSIGKSLKQQRSAANPALSSEEGYFVNITGSRRASRNSQYRGLVGKRVGRGPVSVVPGRSTKAITVAFAKVMEAQTQLSQLQAEVERLKRRS